MSGPQLALPVAYDFTRLPAPADHVIHNHFARFNPPEGSFVRGVEVGLDGDQLVVHVEWSEPVG